MNVAWHVHDKLDGANVYRSAVLGQNAKGRDVWAQVSRAFPGEWRFELETEWGSSLAYETYRTPAEAKRAALAYWARERSTRTVRIMFLGDHSWFLRNSGGRTDQPAAPVQDAAPSPETFASAPIRMEDDSVVGWEPDDYYREPIQVRTFRNLTTKSVSIQTRIDGSWITVAHADSVTLEDVAFRVQEAARQRTIRTGKKTVHACVHGALRAARGLRLRPGADRLDAFSRIRLGWYREEPAPVLIDPEAITYNPVRFSSFVRRADALPVHSAVLAHVMPSGVLAVLV